MLNSIKMKFPSLSARLITTTLILASTAFAHPGHAPVENFTQGVTHTLAHYAAPLLATLAITGLLAYLLRSPKQKARVRR